MKTTLSTIAAVLALFVSGQMAWAQANVIVTVDNNGNMTVTGDDVYDELILVTASLTPNRFGFSDPQGNTTFNGATAITVDNVSGNMKFNLRKGKNILILDDGPAPDFEVYGNLEITSKGNQSTIVLIDDADIEGQTKITTKDGSDAVWLIATDVENISLNLGKGDDYFAAIGYTADFNRDVQVKMGDGRDLVSFDLATVYGDLDLNFGKGDDVAAFYNSVLMGDAEVNGSGGVDAFGSIGSAFGMGVVLKSIEIPNASNNSLSDAIYSHPMYIPTLTLFSNFNLS